MKKRNILFIKEGLASRKTEKHDTFENHLKRFHFQDKQMLLKIDIEGNKYSIFNQPDIYRHLEKVNQMYMKFMSEELAYARYSDTKDITKRKTIRISLYPGK